MRRQDQRRAAKPQLFKAKGKRVAGKDAAPTDDASAAASTEIDAIEQDLAQLPPEPAPPLRKRTPPGPQKRTMPGITEEVPEKKPRRKKAEPKEKASSGWRASRRTSRAGKQARRAAKVDAARAKAGKALEAGGNAVVRVLKVALASVMAVVIASALLWGAALGINGVVRWNLKRLADEKPKVTAEDKTRENVIIIGVKDKQAVGFVAMKAERKAKRVLGIAIPDGAFMEVPGQGFERVGESFEAGAMVSRDTIANFLGVPFHRYIVVDAEVYQGLVTRQQVSTLVPAASSTNLSKEDKADLEAFLKTVKTDDVWIVPLPVKPVAVGDERYYEPQRGEIADIAMQWWGANLDQQKTPIRIIVYNGIGTPGVAGKAAQQLIRNGFRVVDSRNAENFGYKTTQILLYHGTETDAAAVREALGGVGDVIVQSSAQNVADIIVVVGADYIPPAGP